MKFIFFVAIIFSVVYSSSYCEAAVPPIQIEDMRLELGNSWKMRQDGVDNSKMIFVFTTPNASVTMYVQPDPLSSLDEVFVNGSTMTMDPQRFNFNSHGWTVLETRKISKLTNKQSFVFGFVTVFEGNTYWGYSKSLTSKIARETGIEFLRGLN